MDWSACHTSSFRTRGPQQKKDDLKNEINPKLPLSDSLQKTLCSVYVFINFGLGLGTNIDLIALRVRSILGFQVSEVRIQSGGVLIQTP